MHFKLIYFFLVNLSTIGMSRAYSWHKAKNQKAICDTSMSSQPSFASQNVVVEKQNDSFKDLPAPILG